jgi:hypothetical protein
MRACVRTQLEPVWGILVFLTPFPWKQYFSLNYTVDSFMCHLKDKAKNKDKFFPAHAMKAYGGVEV